MSSRRTRRRPQRRRSGSQPNPFALSSRTTSSPPKPKPVRAGPFDEERLAEERKLATRVEKFLKWLRNKVVSRLNRDRPDRHPYTGELVRELKQYVDVVNDSAFWAAAH